MGKVSVVFQSRFYKQWNNLIVVFLDNANEGKTSCELVKFSKMCTNKYKQLFCSGITKKVSQCQPGSLIIEKASRAAKWHYGTFPGCKYFRSKHGPFPEQLAKRKEKIQTHKPQNQF